MEVVLLPHGTLQEGTLCHDSIGNGLCSQLA